MGETPKTRGELQSKLSVKFGRAAGKMLAEIESIGLRIVPADPTDEMIAEFDWLTEKEGCGVRESLIEAIAKSPFAPANPHAGMPWDAPEITNG